MSYVAIVTGEVPYEGKLELITEGVTYVADGHELVRRFPHMFKKAAGMSGPRNSTIRTGSARSPAARATRTSAAPAARNRRSSGGVELRTSSESPIAVVLDEGARTRIVNEVLDHASDYAGEGRESGGYLFGRRRRSSSHALGPQEPDLLEVTFAAYAGEGTQRGSHSMKHDSDYGLSIERTLRRRGRERLVGDYHSHPDDGGVPSPGDLRGWLRSFQLLGVQSDDRPEWLLGDEVTPNCYIGMIVTRSAGGSWTWPQLHVWITRQENGLVVCEPALLTVY
jgi:proteasome lid subunit RPN8/RPN11